MFAIQLMLFLQVAIESVCISATLADTLRDDTAGRLKGSFVFMNAGWFCGSSHSLSRHKS